jgi:hypothetical protein
MQSAVALISGLIVMWSIVVRYKTINSPEFTENVRATIFAFSAFAIGLLIADPTRATKAPDMISSHWLIWFFVIAPFFIPTIYRVLHGYTLANAINFRYLRVARDWFMDHGINAVIILIVISIGLPFIIEIFIGILREFVKSFGWVVPIALFISFAVFLGFIHAVLGSVLLGLNIALIITHFFNTGALGGFDLGTVFDLFEKVGVSSTPAKWLVMFSSIALGVHSCTSLSDLRDMVRDLMSP